MTYYRKKIGRIAVAVNQDGIKNHDYGHGCEVSCLDGWNDSCRTLTHNMSVEELRDLQYLIGRALAAADAE